MKRLTASSLRALTLSVGLLALFACERAPQGDGKAAAAASEDRKADASDGRYAPGSQATGAASLPSGADPAHAPLDGEAEMTVEEEAAPEAIAAANPSPAKSRKKGSRALGGAAANTASAPPPPSLADQRDKDSDGFNDDLVPSDTKPEPIPENKFVAVVDDPLSTFSIDVDTAAYAYARQAINDGGLPSPHQVRLEEYVNYFPYDYEAPATDSEVPFSVHAETAPSPFNEGRHVVKVGLKGKEVAMQETGGKNLVFLLDVSGSMNNADKLPLLKRGMSLLVEQLDGDDTVSIVVYAGASGVVLDPTSGDAQQEILDALQRLEAGGSTNGGAGIELAYKLAEKNFKQDGINRVILATDGDFNVGPSSQKELERLIERKRGKGVYLSVLGFGRGSSDSRMETLADKGNGNYAFIDSVREARKVLVSQVGGTLVTIAKDVKIQVEFDPQQVAEYRLLGYENRAIADVDFRNDKKDAGEIGAGHTVTALYEVQLTNKVEASDDLATVRLRYKKPDGNGPASEIAQGIALADGSFDEASTDMRFAASVAGVAMLLRGSKHSGDATLSDMKEIAEDAVGQDPGGYRREFLTLVERAIAIES